MPAAAINFCRRSGISTYRSFILDAAGEILKIFDARQLGQISEAKLNQKVLRSPIHHWPSNRFLASFGDDEPLVEQRLDRGRRLHTANFQNLGDRHRLFVSNYRKGFERRERK